MKDLLYVVEPIEFMTHHRTRSRANRSNPETMGYVHLQNNDATDLADRYSATS